MFFLVSFEEKSLWELPLSLGVIAILWESSSAQHRSYLEHFSAAAGIARTHRCKSTIRCQGKSAAQIYRRQAIHELGSSQYPLLPPSFSLFHSPDSFPIFPIRPPAHVKRLIYHFSSTIRHVITLCALVGPNLLAPLCKISHSARCMFVCVSHSAAEKISDKKFARRRRAGKCSCCSVVVLFSMSPSTRQGEVWWLFFSALIKETKSLINQKPWTIKTSCF